MMSQVLRSIDSEWEGDDFLILDDQKVFRHMYNLKPHIRSIDAGWEEDSLVVINPTINEFRKVINNGKELIALFKDLDEIASHFIGPTWVYWTPNTFSYLEIENKKINFLKVCDDHKCTYVHKRVGSFFKDENGFVNGINHPKHHYNDEIVAFYEKGHYEKDIPGGSVIFIKKHHPKEYSFHLDYLRQYDE